MNKHTPGPWKIEPFAGLFIVWPERTGKAESVANCHRNEANARLIAAAPELLAALRNLLYVIDSEQLEDYLADDQKLVAKAARAALAKVD